MTIRLPMCAFCRHFNAAIVDRNTCDAFPTGIPREIAFGPRDHVDPYPGDHGIQFEPKEDVPEWVYQWRQERLAKRRVASA
jgi:hypothetical protein